MGCNFLLQDMESYRLSLSHHCHMIFCSSSNFLHLCEVCKFPQLIVWIQQLRSILSNAAGWRWSLTPSGIKRLLSFSIFSQDIPLCWSHPHPYHPTLMSLSGGNRQFLWLLLVSKCPDGSCKAYLVLPTRFSHTQEECLTSATPNSQVRYCVFGK